MALPPIIDSGISAQDMLPTDASVDVPVEDQIEMFRTVPRLRPMDRVVL